MQVRTERGLIWVEQYASTTEEAKNLGYDYTFYSNDAKAKCFSRIVDGKLNSRKFCLVKDKED